MIDKITLVFESTYHVPESITTLYNIHILILAVILFFSLIFRKTIFKYKGIFILFIILSFLYYNLLEHEINISKEIHNSIKNKTYKTVEGKIQNLKVMPKTGHLNETFEINNISFSTNGTSFNEQTKFFNSTKHYGSPIQKNGQYIKAYYLDEKINTICFFFLPRCFEFDEGKKIIKLWVEKSKNTPLQ